MLEVAVCIPDWHLDALCREDGYNPDDWFADNAGPTARAKKICERCLVQKDCLGWALDEGPQLAGVWAARPKENGSSC